MTQPEGPRFGGSTASSGNVDGSIRQHLYVVFARPKPGMYDDFRSWYQQNNLDNLLAIDGIRSLRRYELAFDAGDEGPPGPFLGIYQVDGDRLELARRSWDQKRAERDLAERKGRESYILRPPALDRSVAWWYSAITPEIVRPDVR